MRLQASIFLKYINKNNNNDSLELTTENDQINSQIENARNRLNNYVTKYNIESKLAFDIIINELQEIENANAMVSYEAVQKKSNIFKDFKSKNGKESKEQECICYYNEAYTLWEYITNVSKRNNLEIPSVFVDFDELNLKYNEMMKTFQFWGKNLDKESELMKNYEEELNKVNSIEDAEKFICKLSEFYDMKNWQNYHIKTIMYRAGMKYEYHKKNFDREVQQLKDDFNEKLNYFNKIYYMCIEKLNDENYKTKYETIYIDMNPLSNSLGSIQKAFEELNIKSKNNGLQMPDLNEKMKYIEKLAYNYKTNQLFRNCENEFSNLCNKCDVCLKKVRSVVDENEYSINIYQNKKEYFYYYLELPEIDEFKKAFDLIENKNLCKYTIDDALKKINNFRNEMRNTLEILKQRETFSLEIENVSNETREIFNDIKYNSLSSTFQQYNKAKNAFEKLQNIKNWPENSVGSTINVYYTTISYVDNLLNYTKEKIYSMFNSDIERINSTLSFTKQNYIKETERPEKDDISFYIGLDKIAKSFIIMTTLFTVNDEMIYERKKELEDMMTELESCKNQIETLKSKIHDRIFKKLNEYRNIILDIINGMKKIDNDFIYDNSHLNEINFDYIEKKCDSVISQFTIIRYCQRWMINNNKKYNFDVEIPDMQNVLVHLRDLVIFYQSKFLLKPLSTTIHDVYHKSRDPILSLSAAYVYVNEFTNRKSTFQIENDISQIKKSVETFLFSDPSFIKEAIIKIQEEISRKSKDLDFELLNELEILADALRYLPNFSYSSITSIIPYLEERYDTYDIVKKLEMIEDYSISNTLICIAKDYIPIVEERRKHYINSDPTIIIDLGSYNVRNAFSYKGIITVDEQTEKVYKSFIEILTEIITKIMGYQNVSKINKSVFKILDKYKNKLYELLDNRDEKVTLFITSHQFDLKAEDFVSEIFSSYEFINNFALIDPSVGIVRMGNDDSGIAVDIGDSCLSITPVLDKRIVPHCRILTEQGGNKIAMDFQENLEPIGLEKNQIKRIKCLDGFRHERTKVLQSDDEYVDDDIQIPDLIVHGKSRKAILTPDSILFNNGDSLTNLIIKAAKDASMFTKKDVIDFLSNIVLVGGTSETN